MADTYEHNLQWLLELIQGTRWPYSKGLVSYDIADPGQQGLHQACLELERRGHLVRHEDGLPGIAWMPREPLAEKAAGEGCIAETASER